jgi:hypothetical protein
LGASPRFFAEGKKAQSRAIRSKSSKAPMRFLRAFRFYPLRPTAQQLRTSKIKEIKNE